MNWSIDGTDISRQIAESATPRGVSLTFRVTTAVLESDLRPLKSDEGKVDVLGTDDGGFVAIDRANGGNTYQLDPPESRKPLRQPGAYHVRRYEESLVSQDVGEWEVEVEFVYGENRTDEPAISQTPGAEEWGITTRYGTIATDTNTANSVDATVVGTGEGGVKRFELRARLTFEQARVFEAALNRLGAGRVRQVPDAPNVAVDDSADDAATVTLDTPDSQTVVSDGDYVVTEWESERLSDAFQRVTFTVAST